MLKILILFILPIATGCSTSATSYPVAKNATDVWDIIQKEPAQKYKEDTWVVFDLYHTLVNAKHPATAPQNMLTHKGWLKAQFKDLSKNQMEWLINASISHKKGLILTDPAFPQMIQRLEGGAHVCALTTSLAGPFGSIPDLKIWTRDTLQKLGISFLYSAPIIYEVELESHTKPHNPVLHHDGIFYTNGEYGLTKGEAMGLMVKHVRTPPTLIFMVDDKEKNLQSIESSLKTNYPDIKFVGILFKAQTSASVMNLSAFHQYWCPFIDQAKKRVA